MLVNVNGGVMYPEGLGDLEGVFDKIKKATTTVAKGAVKVATAPVKVAVAAPSLIAKAPAATAALATEAAKVAGSAVGTAAVLPIAMQATLAKKAIKTGAGLFKKSVTGGSSATETPAPDPALVAAAQEVQAQQEAPSSGAAGFLGKKGKSTKPTDRNATLDAIRSIAPKLTAAAPSSKSSANDVATITAAQSLAPTPPQTSYTGGGSSLPYSGGEVAAQSSALTTTPEAPAVEPEGLMAKFAAASLPVKLMVGGAVVGGAYLLYRTFRGGGRSAGPKS